MSNDSNHEQGAPVEEVKRVHELVGQAARPLGFQMFDVAFDEDAGGDPAIRISFWIDPAYPTTAPDIRRLTELGTSVKDALFKAGITRVPYVRFRSRTQAAG